MGINSDLSTLQNESVPVNAGNLFGNLNIGSPQTDPFDRVRVSETQVLVDLNFLYDTQPLLTQTTLVGTGSATKPTGKSVVVLSTGGTASGAGADFQSKRYARYHPGQGTQVVMTGTIGAYTQYVRSQIGYFDSNNGLFFDMDGTSQGLTGVPSVTYRTNITGSVVDTPTLQPNWNVDKLDGTGPSGVTVDWSLPQQFVIDMEWLGVGSVRFGVRLYDDLVYCHIVNFANSSFAPPFINNPNLPCHWAIHNTGAATAASSIYASCGLIACEGNSDTVANLSFSAQNLAGVTAPKLDYKPLISISPALLFNGLANRSLIRPKTARVLNDSNNPVYFQILYNPTLTGATFSSVNSSSAVNQDTSATVVTDVTDGLVLYSGWCQPGNSGGGLTAIDISGMELPFTLNAAGTVSDVLTIAVYGIGNTALCYGSFDWEEVR